MVNYNASNKSGRFGKADASWFVNGSESGWLRFKGFADRVLDEPGRLFKIRRRFKIGRTVPCLPGKKMNKALGLESQMAGDVNSLVLRGIFINLAQKKAAARMSGYNRTDSLCTLYLNHRLPVPLFMHWVCAAVRAVVGLVLYTRLRQNTEFSSVMAVGFSIPVERFIAHGIVFLARYGDVFVVKE